MKKGVKKILCTACALMTIVNGAEYMYAAAAESESEAVAGAGAEAEAGAEETLVGWVRDENGNMYYYHETFGMIKGTHCNIDGELFLFAPNGVLKTGWQSINNKRFYFDEKTGAHVYGWFDYNGEKYYIDKSDGKVTGMVNIDGDKYIFDENGILYRSRFAEVNGYHYYCDKDGSPVWGTFKINDIEYAFAESGVLKTGWQSPFGNKRFFYDRKTGKQVYGKIFYNGCYYYVDKENGKITGDYTINGIPYKFDETYGYMLQGWQEIDNYKYYYENGEAAVGLKKIEDFTYFFSEDGKLSKGWLKSGDDTYYADSEYHILSGWNTFRGLKYYFDPDTYKLVKGTTEINGKKYLLHPDNGSLQTGFVTINNDLYYADENGIINTGWLDLDGNRYFINEDGIVLQGWQEIENKKYYFEKDGETPGKMLTGLCEIDGNLYLFDEDTGVMAINTIYKDYVIGADGIAVKSNTAETKAAIIISEIGTDVTGIFSYIRGNNNHANIEKITTPEETEKKGWSYYAEYAMNERNVVSTYFAALTDILLKAAGHESRIVYGTGRSSTPHYWNQVKIDDKWTNYDCCNGYANVSDTYLEKLNYTFLQYIYPEYTKKENESEELK